MTPTPGVCPHCGANVIRTLRGLDGRPLYLHKVVRGAWLIDQAGYAYPSRRGTHNTHPCQQEAT